MATSTLAILQPKSLIRPTHWSKEVENAYRFQLAGYRDELEYKHVRNVTEVGRFRLSSLMKIAFCLLFQIDTWPDSGFVKKLQRRKDGCFYYFDKLRECPDKEIKKCKIYSY